MNSFTWLSLSTTNTLSDDNIIVRSCDNEDFGNLIFNCRKTLLNKFT